MLFVQLHASVYLVNAHVISWHTSTRVHNTKRLILVQNCTKHPALPPEPCCGRTKG